MNFKNKKIYVTVTALGLSIGVLLGGYSVLNKNIVLIDKGKEMSISTFKSNVKEVLESENIKYDSNDIISVSLDSKIKDDMKIEVIDVKEETIKESKTIPYEISVKEDSSLEKGQVETEKEGKQGKNELVYKVVYHNGKKVEKKFIEELVAEVPENKIIKKGTKVEVQVATSRSEISRNNSTSSSQSGRTHMTVVATAYSGDGKTSTGTVPKWGTIAVDPSVIPYGTKVYIPQFDMTFVAEDTGGAIKGNKIDIFMSDSTRTKNWGRRTIDIYVLG